MLNKLLKRKELLEVFIKICSELGMEKEPIQHVAHKIKKLLKKKEPKDHCLIMLNKSSAMIRKIEE